VQGILEGSHDKVVPRVASGSIASSQPAALSEDLLDLVRKAGKADPDWQATKETVLRKDRNVAEQFRVQDVPLFYVNCWVIPKDPALKLSMLSGNLHEDIHGQGVTVRRSRTSNHSARGALCECSCRRGTNVAPNKKKTNGLKSEGTTLLSVGESKNLYSLRELMLTPLQPPIKQITVHRISSACVADIAMTTRLGQLEARMTPSTVRQINVE
jgi:hypothetical protein